MSDDDDNTKRSRELETKLETCDTVPLEVQRERHPDVLTKLGGVGASLVLLVGVVALVVAAAVVLHSWCECPVSR